MKLENNLETKELISLTIQNLLLVNFTGPMQIMKVAFFYVNLLDLLNVTEELFSGMVKKITGDYKLKYRPDPNKEDVIEIDFTPPFRRVKMIPTLEEMLKVTFPENLDTDEANQFLADLVKKHNVKCSPPLTTSRLLDKLVGEFIEPSCVNPTFIMEHPQ
jgi:lysyl-tRNA synthetase, class II